jgi:hypothetical protein
MRTLATLAAALTAVALVALPALVTLTAGCGDSDSAAPSASGNGPPPDAPAPDRTDLVRIIDAMKTAGGAMKGDVTWYSPANLFDYINGMATLYTDNGFVQLAHTEWQPAAGARPYVEADLYDQAAPAGANAVLQVPPDAPGRDLGGGVTAYGDANILEFVAGRYYVRLTARHDAAALAPLMDALAKAVAAAASK